MKPDVSTLLDLVREVGRARASLHKAARRIDERLAWGEDRRALEHVFGDDLSAADFAELQGEYAAGYLEVACGAEVRS